MTLLSRYVLRRIATPFWVSLGVVLLALVLERMLEITQTVTDVGAPIWRAVELIAYLVPHYLGLAIPAALFLGVLLGLRRLYVDSELTVVYAGGIPFTRLLRPIVGLALILAALIAVNAALVQPFARYAHRATLHELVTRPLNFKLEPGVFHDFGNGTIVRADRVAQGGSRLQGVFAATEDRAGRRTLVVARQGRIALGRDGDALVLHLSDGDLIRYGGPEGGRRVAFEDYTWQLSLGERGPYGGRGQDERELTLPELASGARGRLPEGVGSARVGAELATRLIEPLSLPVLAVLAAPFAVLGSGGRTVRATGLVLAVAMLVLYQKLQAFAGALAAEGSVSPLLAQGGVLLAFGLFAAILLRVATEGLRRSPARRRGPNPAGADAEPA